MNYVTFLQFIISFIETERNFFDTDVNISYVILSNRITFEDLLFET